MLSNSTKGLMGIATFSYVLISCTVLTYEVDVIEGNIVEIIQVKQGRDFTLKCPVGTTSNISKKVDWYHEGQHWNGSQVFHVNRSNPSDGGIYFCSHFTGNKTMHVIIGNITVQEGARFELQCEGKTNSSDNQDVVWTKNGKVMSNWTGNATLSVVKAHLTDGGVYICNNSGEVKQMNVVVGKVPSLPPKPECLDSPNTVIQCNAYPGEFLQANVICLTVNAIGVWGNRYPVCHNCFTGNRTVTCHVDFKNQVDDHYEIISEVANYVISSTRSVSYKNLQKKVIPDPPTVVNMTATGFDSFTTWFRIPITWNERIGIFVRGNYTQNGETHTVNQKDRYTSYKGQYGKFQLITAEAKAYSLVCWTIQIRFDYGFTSTTWSNPSEPACEYTFMAAPSERPKELNASFEQDKESPEFRNVALSWKPPSEENCNGIIDHYEMVLSKVGLDKEEAVQTEIVPGDVTNFTFYAIESYETFSAKLTAWTQAGHSPPIQAVIKAIPKPTAAIQLMLGIAIAIAAMISLIVFARVIWIMRQTVSADHLPEPYFIPEEKMKYCLAQKPFLPGQKEVFDMLNDTTEESKAINDDKHGTTALTTISVQNDAPLASGSGQKSEETQDTYRSSSGASCYMLMSSTDDALETDDTSSSNEVVSELTHDSENKSQLLPKTNDYAQDYNEIELGVASELIRLTAINGTKIYDKFGTCDEREDHCHRNVSYENCIPRVAQEDVSGNGQTLQPCNDPENSGYYTIASREGVEDQTYKNYTSFIFRVHDIMTKLNDNKDVI